jgi:hypothetical protein
MAMISMTRNTIFACAIGLLMIGGTTLSANAASPVAPDQSQTPPSILVFDQKVDGSEVLIEYAYMPSDGYILVYGADKDGNKKGEPLGKLALEAGDHRKFKVPLTSAPPAGSAAWASLYANVDGKPGIDRNQDKSFWAQALPMENRFLIR